MRLHCVWGDVIRMASMSKYLQYLANNYQQENKNDIQKWILKADSSSARLNISIRMYLLEILYFISSLKLWKVAPTVWIKFWVQWQPNSIRSKCQNFFDFMRRKKSKDLEECYVHGLPSHLFPQEIPANSGPNKGPRRLSLTNALRNIFGSTSSLQNYYLAYFVGRGDI